MVGVYIKLDERGVIIDLDDGLHIKDKTGWLKIDEGEGDEYYLSRGNYRLGSKPVRENNGVFNYKYENGSVIERAPAEIRADIDALPPAPPSLQKQIDALHTANQYSFCKWDGIKYIADPERPIPLTLPMQVIRNMIYLYEGVRYVALKDGTATEKNFAGYLTEF